MSALHLTAEVRVSWEKDHTYMFCYIQCSQWYIIKKYIINILIKTLIEVSSSVVSTLDVLILLSPSFSRFLSAV